MMDPNPDLDLDAVAADLRRWGRELGFAAVGIARIELEEDERRLLDWLGRQRHGQMGYMARHGVRRARPAELLAGTVRVVSARMDYLAEDQQRCIDRLDAPGKAYVSRYALGRDYHKVLRRRLRQLAERLHAAAGGASYRVFVDSAPVLEKALARNAGLGWIGKHTNLIDKDSGSWFFLGEIFTDIPLPPDTPATNHCGSCRACIDVCPTRAIVAPYELDARRCISYLTIENRGAIPEEFRRAMGNRIYGCDDCQLFCPWNKFASLTREPDFAPRHGLADADLVELFAWSEACFDEKTRGSAIRRAGYIGWLRNIAVALGNTPTSPEVVAALRARATHPNDMLREHVHWALARHEARDDL